MTKIISIDELRDIRDAKARPNIAKNATDLAVDAYHERMQAVIEEARAAVEAIKRSRT